MMDIGSISVAIDSTKAAYDIAMFLKNSDANIDAAVQKMKLAELMEQLTKAKLSTAELNNLLLEKDAKIRALEERLRDDTELNFDGQFHRDQDGQLFCPKCKAAGKRSHIRYSPEKTFGDMTQRAFYFCTVCNEKTLD